VGLIIRFRFRTDIRLSAATDTASLIPTLVGQAPDPRHQPVLLDILAVSGQVGIRVAVPPVIDAAVTVEVTMRYSQRSYKLLSSPNTLANRSLGSPLLRSPSSKAMCKRFHRPLASSWRVSSGAAGSSRYASW